VTVAFDAGACERPFLSKETVCSVEASLDAGKHVTV
jgi:hypothetical protein